MQHVKYLYLHEALAHGIILSIGIVLQEKHLLQLFQEHLQYREKDIILILDRLDVIGILSSMEIIYSTVYFTVNIMVL